jgi:hypothetical protein
MGTKKGSIHFRWWELKTLLTKKLLKASNGGSIRAESERGIRHGVLLWLPT